MRRSPVARPARRAAAAAAVSALSLVAVVAGTSTTQASAAPSESRTGILVEAHGDDLDSGHEHEGYGLKLADGSHLELKGVGAKAHDLVGRKVTLKGRANGHEFDVDPSTLVALGGTTTGTTVAATTVAAPTTKNIAVVLINFTVPAGSTPATPWTAAQVDSVLFSGTSSVAAYYRDLSQGAWTLTGSIYGYYTVPASTTCDYSAWSSAAQSQASAAGVNLSAFSNVVYLFPQQSSCGWAGLGELPGTQSWINGSLTTRTIGHELGHNFGEHHASTARCTDATGAAVEWSGTCSMSEYGDPFSIMGATTTLQHASALSHYGLLSPVDATADGTWTLAPAYTAGGVRLLRVPRGDGTWLALDFRQPTGVFDTWAAGSAVTSGVGIRVDYGNGWTQTKLIDTTPSTTSFADAALTSGRAWTDPVSGVTLAVGAVTSTGAQVSVSYGADAVAPSAVSGLTATPAVNGSSVALSWTAATDNRGVASYNVVTGGTVVGTATGTTATVATTPGTAYSLGVQAVDAAGNVGPLTTIAVTTPVPDTIAPTPVPSVKGSASKNRTVKLTWTAATDNVGVVAYVVSRAGTADRTVTTLAFSERVGAGSYTWSVRAKDAAGNLSAPTSLALTVR